MTIDDLIAASTGTRVYDKNNVCWEKTGFNDNEWESNLFDPDNDYPTCFRDSYALWNKYEPITQKKAV